MTDSTTQSGDARRAANALERLALLHPKLIDLGLERSFDLLEKLGNPHHRLPPTIHVAGTNGKGSVIALMRSMAEAAGLKVHVYASPHLCRFNERIRLVGNLIGDGALADLLEEVEAANGEAPVTFFEVTTAAAMLAFSRQQADFLLLETGLGGALDSTNVLAKPAATVITPIARDHEHFLGNDIAGIAGQKAGIMRPGVPCYSAHQLPEAGEAIARHATEIGAILRVAGSDFTWQTRDNGGLDLDLEGRRITLPKPGLVGAHQQENAGLAAAVMLNLLSSDSADLAVSGVAKATWPGRIQHLDQGVLANDAGRHDLWLDGAHNAHGATALAAALPDLGGAKWHIICGALNTRNPADFLAPLAGLAASVTTVTIPDQDASLSATELRDTAMALGLDAASAPSLRDAVRALATKNDSIPAIICGSLYLAGHVLTENKTPPI